MIFSLVIPAYNEENGIADIIRRTLQAKAAILAVDGINELEVIVVNDGSKDHTAEVVASFKEVRLIQHSSNRGYGAALKTGFESASGHLIGFLDADGTYPPEFFPKLIKSLLAEKADMAIGSRMMGARSGMPVTRYIGNRLFAWLLSWIVGKKITDTASGLRVFRKEALNQLYPLPDGLDLTPAMSTKAIHEKLKIIETPMPYAERVGRSKLSVVKDGVRFFNTIVGIARLYNPLKFFGILGAILILLGVILAMGPVTHYLRFRRVEDYEVYRLFTIMVLWVTGINVISFGAFCNSLLGVIHGKPVHTQSAWSTYIFRPPIMRNLDKVGYVLIAVAIALNHKTIIEYVTTRQIDVHWSYIFTGATLFLVGVQLAMTSFLLKVVEELRGVKNARVTLRKAS
ncbi:MAG: glycosyltransferase family 2 protein [Acidobacteria bacterium]|nr:glycosyltransferase family 2 protein [Acidobacteriota bacterium]MBI3655256.1 glycosyltransferase family 2 protein [Acidobacteriota bacterium]